MCARIPGWILILLAAATAPGGAATRCKLLMSSPLPVKMEGLRPVISADINGVPARFIIDTGSFFDFLSPAAAAQFKLPLSFAPPGYYVSGVGGTVVPQVATAKTFSVAGLTAHDALFLVGNNDFQGGQAGLLGQNLFRVADVDYDFADGVLRFVRPQHCGDAVLAYWAAHMPIGVVDLRWTSQQRPHLIGKASVNGQDIRVLFDTGSPRTILSLAAARRAGITPDTPGVVPAGETSGTGRRMIKVWSAPVDKFEIGGEAIEHTHFLIGDVGLSELGADMLLGSDFFLAHHIYVAYSQDKLYFTYNGGPVFDLNARRPVTAASAPRGNSPGPGAAPDSGAPSNLPTDAAGFMRRGMAETSREAIADDDAALEQTHPDETKNRAFPLYLRGLAELRKGLKSQGQADLAAARKLRPDIDRHYSRMGLTP